MNSVFFTNRYNGCKICTWSFRRHLTATWKVEEIWSREKTELTQYLVWRYIGTADGVFRQTPGAVFQKSYDPRQRPW